MKTKWILIATIAITAVIAPSLVQAETYGDVTCTERFYPSHLYSCRDVNNNIIKSFRTYAEMDAYFAPMVDTFIPEVTYVYSGATSGI